MNTEKIAFDHELSRGIVAYNEKVGLWWHRQSANSIHRYAYRNIADFIRSSFSRTPRVIVDYACGAGNLLSRLQERFPTSRLMGVDGSSFLLGMARKRLVRQGNGASPHVTLVETLLPDFELPRAVADLVVFAFPNMVPCSAEENGNPCAHQLSRNDRVLARELADRRAPESAGAEDESEPICAALIRDRLVALNIRRLLNRGATCVRVEYGNVRREELPELELLRTEFEEGSLDHKVNGIVPDQWFRVVASCYYRSGVMEDVYHQSEDESDKAGGYFITVLRAC
ncbi:MAG: class I SAM-dependent methyltransferase [Acidobacteriia bacterium]|nr:class I SAM-dependent methyltransferase [Terriglobia bacterium]